jgi:hypothetical protein
MFNVKFNIDQGTEHLTDILKIKYTPMVSCVIHIYFQNVRTYLLTRCSSPPPRKNVLHLIASRYTDYKWQHVPLWGNELLVGRTSPERAHGL